jgi:hypothetical protein
MPDEQQLPPGSRRDLTTALHDLYELAGKPAARAISAWIRAQDDLPGTLSHEGVSAVLRGANVPRWANLESLVRVLVKQQRVGEAADVDTVVMRIHALWRIADGSPPLLREISPTPPAIQEADSNEEDVPDQCTSRGGSGSDGPSREPAPRTSAQEPLIRWNPRQRTIDVYDRQMAVEIIKEVWSVNDQP